MENNDKTILSSLSSEEKKIYLYNEQKKLLDTFLEHHAITKEQYNKSLHDLTVKMNIKQE